MDPDPPLLAYLKFGMAAADTLFVGSVLCRDSGPTVQASLHH